MDQIFQYCLLYSQTGPINIFQYIVEVKKEKLLQNICTP